jgi:NADH-quinone oxidoreductase subunit L
MIKLLWLIPTLPFLGALILILTGSRLSWRIAACIGAGSIGLAAILTILVGYDFLASGKEAYLHVAWNWFQAGDLSTTFSFYLDSLSMVFIFVITFVGFLIHIYSIEFMQEDVKLLSLHV